MLKMCKQFIWCKRFVKFLLFVALPIGLFMPAGANQGSDTLSL